MIAMIATRDWLCWLAESCKILLLQAFSDLLEGSRAQAATAGSTAGHGW